MALKNISFSILSINRSLLCVNPLLNASKTCMSVYAPYYVDPVFKKDKLSELIESGEAEKRISSPVKPPLPFESSSDIHDETVSKFTNHIMKKGRKLLARSLVEQCFEHIKRAQIERYHLATEPEVKESIELDPKIVLHQAILNCQPVLTLTPIKRGGSTYQVPVPVTEKRSRFLSMKWLIEAAKERDTRFVRFPAQMAWELVDAANGRGRVVKRKQDLHKQCEANRAYAHYRWG